MFYYSKFQLERKTPQAVGFDLCVDLTDITKVESAPWCKRQARLELEIDWDISGKDNVVTLYPGGFYRVPSGLYVELINGICGDVRPRSGTGFKHAIRIELGAVDPDYRGEVLIQFEVLGTEPIKLKHGESIAQLMLSKVVTDLVPLDTLQDFINCTTKTERGSNGFGHTDRGYYGLNR